MTHNTVIRLYISSTWDGGNIIRKDINTDSCAGVDNSFGSILTVLKALSQQIKVVRNRLHLLIYGGMSHKFHCHRMSSLKLYNILNTAVNPHDIHYIIHL